MQFSVNVERLTTRSCAFRPHMACCPKTTQNHVAVIVALDNKPQLLFKYKHGTVTATIYGPPMGFQWTRVEYLRWIVSTKELGKWEKCFPDREVDQLHLQQCVRAVRQWFKERILATDAPDWTAR
jgi:hypothetical protein